MNDSIKAETVDTEAVNARVAANEALVKMHGGTITTLLDKADKLAKTTAQKLFGLFRAVETRGAFDVVCEGAEKAWKADNTVKIADVITGESRTRPAVLPGSYKTTKSVFLKSLDTAPANRFGFSEWLAYMAVRLADQPAAADKYAMPDGFLLINSARYDNDNIALWREDTRKALEAVAIMKKVHAKEASTVTAQTTDGTTVAVTQSGIRGGSGSVPAFGPEYTSALEGFNAELQSLNGADFTDSVKAEILREVRNFLRDAMIDARAARQTLEAIDQPEQVQNVA